ncbi:hypothetical protein [Sphingobium sp. HDIP04]|uniref:hypothetical protein n=1 Tax=Sphingobium sp. HDIP04 TaxID=428994 RepID=UPI0003879F07|nr:hypothetical protein [Sphingobium sp. HDIP04]EQB03934.1 hypothetical protein L286_11265 [Sphingobium sp. HDIP04]
MMDGKVDQEIERIAQEAEWEARKMIGTGRTITSADVAKIAVRMGRQAGLREAAEVAMGLHALPRLAPADAYDQLPRIEGAITYDTQDVDCYGATARRIADAITALIEGEGE